MPWEFNPSNFFDEAKKGESTLGECTLLDVKLLQITRRL